MKLISLAFIVLGLPAFGQNNSGARLMALGSSGTAIRDYWSGNKNQAGLSEVKKTVAAINYEQRYFNEDISIQSAALIYPALKYVFAAAFTRYGITEYNEQHTALACARQWGGLSIGLAINYHQLKIHNYGSADAFSADIGVQYQFNDMITLGAHIANPSYSSYNKEVNASVPVVMDFGAAFKVSDRVLISSEIEQALNSTLCFKAGTEYNLIKWLDLRCGISSNPLREYFGFGIRHQRLRFDAATYNQNYLGFVPQIGLSYEF